MIFLIPLIIFSQFTTPHERRIIIDAEGNFLIYARYYQGTLIGIDTIKSMSDHLATGIAAKNLSLLTKEFKKDITKKGGYANKGLFGTFEIPLPRGGFSEFMGETGKLDVGGHVKITLGGSETFVSNLPGAARPSLWPELEMNQEMAINLDGQVGDRIGVFIDHNSERVNETQNKITVTYIGREDEIIQEIEGGDTELSIPKTTYTGDIPSHRGLFGIKSTAKLGPLDFVAIASNEQTQHQEIDIEGAVQAQSDTVWAVQYAKRRFFWLGTTDQIIQQSLQVYIDDNNYQNNNVSGITYFGVAHVDANDDNVPDDTARSEDGYYTLQLLNDDYVFLPGDNIIELKTNLQVNVEVLGVYYEKMVNGQVDTVGSLPSAADTTIQLKLICPKSFDTLSPTYDYELKNYYQIMTPGSRLDSLKIYYKTSGEQHKDRQGDVPFIELLGLDQNPKDGRVDDYSFGGYGFDPNRGLLIFPIPLPFVSTVLDDPDPEIYTNPYYMQGTGKYYIYLKTIETKPVFELPLNVINVKVYVDGQQQEEGKDYYVDYDAGKLEFKKTIPPTARVKIHAEYAPFFSAAQKSLIGMRASMRPFGDATLGSSFFYRTESYPAERIRLREEPFNRMVWEADFALPQSLPFLTKIVDWLPLVETEAESKLNVNFEGAYSISNLNAGSEVFLDDLESSTIITNEMPITKTSWSLASLPVGLNAENFTQERLVWYNPIDRDERLQASDIYIAPLDPNEIADVLKIIFRPNNLSSFGGLMQYIYSENFEDVENLEFIIKGKGGRIHIDLAQEVNEDQLRRNEEGQLVGFGTYEDEDRDRNGSWNEVIEDTGLDTLFGADGDNINGDDGNDDYRENDYTGGINGTEGNRLWDTEDIDHNGILNRDDIYYSYSIELDSLEFLVENAGLKEGWKMFRVPIKDSLIIDTVVRVPDWRNIKFVRIWFDNFVTAETLLVYKLSATGSRWKNYGIKGDTLTIDSTEIFTLTPVNTKTHSYYKSPYGAEIDPLTGQTKSEGGLELRLQNIKDGHACVAHRRTDDNEDYRAYDTLTFYLNAHQSYPVISLKIGSDSLNYYEYTIEYNNGIPALNGYRLFKVSMQRFLDLKKETQGDSMIGDSIYTVVGNPSLSANKFFELQIKNQFNTPLTDTIWFNDIKLVSPKTEIGRIIRAIGSINFADLASIAVTFDESDGRFKRLSESKDISISSAGRNYSVSSNISLAKFLPQGWGFRIPVGFSYRNTVQKPRFAYFANDLEIEGAELEKQKSTSIVNSYTLHISKSGSKNWLLKNTLDKLSFDYSHSNSFSRSALNADTLRNSTYRATYSLDPKVSFKLFNQTFSILPQLLTFTALYTDNFSQSYYRSRPDTAFKISDYGFQHRKTLNPSFSMRYSPHQTITTNYDFSQTRDSVEQLGTFGEEVGRNQSLSATFTKDLKIVSPSLSYTTSYNEDHRFEIRGNEDLRNVSNTARYGVNSRVDLQRIVKFFTRLRDETKDSLLTVGSPAWLAKQIEKFVESIQNPMITYSRQRNSNYLNVKKRPELKYQFGFVDSIPSDEIAAGSYPGRGSNESYSVVSGLNLKNINVQFGYNGNINRTFAYGNIETRIKSFSYPNANLQLMRLESLPFLKKFSHSSSINTLFNQSYERRYKVDGDSANLESDSKSISFNPLIGWQSNWVKGISTSINVNYSETITNQYQGASVATTKTLSRGGSTSIAYTFSAPRGLSLPLLRGIKFSSNVSINLSLGYNRNTNYSGSQGTPIYDSSVLTGDLGLSYNFSSSITGGANFSYSENKERIRNQDSKRVGVNIWVNINF